MEHYPDGTLRTEIKNNIKIGYWPSGNKEYEFTYTDEGERKLLLCYHDGKKNTLQYKCAFVRNQKSGDEEWFHDDGTPKEILPFVNGIIDGTGYYWDALGTKKTTTWVRGKNIK